MGMTGSGKSTFVATCTGQPYQLVGHGLDSFTRGVSLHTLARLGVRVHLVDTPGFDDNRRSDVDVLRELAFWLSQAYRSGIRLCGIIYLQRVTDVRLSGTALRALDAFKQMCGPEAFAGVTLLTTGWGLVNHDEHLRALAGARQAELERTHRFWGEILAKGGRSAALPPGQQEALDAVDDIVRCRQSLVLGIQIEMAVESMTLRETGAGQVLCEAYRLDNAKLEKDVATVQAELARAIRQCHDQDIRRLRGAEAELTRNLKRIAEGLRRLEIPVRDVVTRGAEQAEQQTRELVRLAEGLDDTRHRDPPPRQAARGESQTLEATDARAVQKVHLPSMALAQKVVTGSSVLSALAGTASLALTAAACSIM
ncbi:hypothetical protein B0T24DRAFT_357470 [Lasiosphaeria ovina]|uniref:G domain-containing protein n=1 Tax=Lasiosphaeria ovina TaxID=92902 RepID=A0AAE0K367_9PEZI|nr:hypothetical protein B0T24DRAFT_357470 [Lasiosphaeria ovina]